MHIRRRFLCLFILLGFVIGVAQESSGAGPGHQSLKIGFVMQGSITDHGLNYVSNLGRLYLQAHLPDVQTTLVENLQEDAQSEHALEKMIIQGNHLLFSTSLGFLESAQRVAMRHPEVIVMQNGASGKLENMGGYAAYSYEPLYVVGMVAGR